MYLYHSDKLDEGQEFIVTGDKSQLQPKVSQVWWSSDQCPFPGSNLGPGSPHSVVWGAADQAVIMSKMMQ